jgi:hypothetical protein
MKLALAPWPSQKIAFGQFGLAGIFCYASAKPSELLAVGVFVLRAGPVRPKRGKNGTLALYRRLHCALKRCHRGSPFPFDV